jgi:hypothetical protein
VSQEIGSAPSFDCNIDIKGKRAERWQKKSQKEMERKFELDFM